MQTFNSVFCYIGTESVEGLHDSKSFNVWGHCCINRWRRRHLCSLSKFGGVEPPIIVSDRGCPQLRPIWSLSTGVTFIGYRHSSKFHATTFFEYLMSATKSHDRGVVKSRQQLWILTMNIVVMKEKTNFIITHLGIPLKILAICWEIIFQCENRVMLCGLRKKILQRESS